MCSTPPSSPPLFSSPDLASCGLPWARTLAGELRGHPWSVGERKRGAAGSGLGTAASSRPQAPGPRRAGGVGAAPVFGGPGKPRAILLAPLSHLFYYRSPCLMQRGLAGEVVQAAAAAGQDRGGRPGVRGLGAGGPAWCWGCCGAGQRCWGGGCRRCWGGWHRAAAQKLGRSFLRLL